MRFYVCALVVMLIKWLYEMHGAKINIAFSMLILEIYKSTVHCTEYFLLLYVLPIVYVYYEAWPLTVTIIPYDAWYVSYLMPFMGALIDRWNVSLVSVSKHATKHKLSTICMQYSKICDKIQCMLQLIGVLLAKHINLIFIWRLLKTKFSPNLPNNFEYET